MWTLDTKRKVVFRKLQEFKKLYSLWDLCRVIKPNFMVNELKEKATRIKKYRVLMKVKTGNLFFFDT